MEAFISLSPESTYSTSAVFRLPVPMRNCLFENEMKLTVFQRYSYINCLAECRSDMLFKLCGCVPYHLPYNGRFCVAGVSRITVMNMFNMLLQDRIQFVKWTSSLVCLKIRMFIAELCQASIVQLIRPGPRLQLLIHHAIVYPIVNYNNIQRKSHLAI